MGGALFAALLGWVLGTVLQLQQAELWPLAAYWALLAWALVLALLLGWWTLAHSVSVGVKATWLRLVLVLCAAASASYAQVGWRASIFQSRALPAVLEGVDVWVTGVIDSLPQTRPGSLSDQRLTMQVESYEVLDGQGPDAVLSTQVYGPDAVPRRIQLTRYGDSVWNRAASEAQQAVEDEQAVARLGRCRGWESAGSCQYACVRHTAMSIPMLLTTNSGYGSEGCRR